MTALYHGVGEHQEKGFWPAELFELEHGIESLALNEILVWGILHHTSWIIGRFCRAKEVLVDEFGLHDDRDKYEHLERQAEWKRRWASMAEGGRVPEMKIVGDCVFKEMSRTSVVCLPRSD